MQLLWAEPSKVEPRARLEEGQGLQNRPRQPRASRPASAKGNFFKQNQIAHKSGWSMRARRTALPEVAVWHGAGLQRGLGQEAGWTKCEVLSKPSLAQSA